MNKTNSGVIEVVEDKTVAAIKGTENVAGTVVDSTAQILGTTVKDTAKVGGEVGNAAARLATGAIKDVEKVGVKAEHATAAVAGGVVKAAAEVGTAAVDTLRKPASKPANAGKSGLIQPGESMSRN
jgi:hypothetical protein